VSFSEEVQVHVHVHYVCIRACVLLLIAVLQQETHVRLICTITFYLPAELHTFICSSPLRVYVLRAWRTTSLRVGGRAARRSCLPGLRRGGGGGRQAGATVLSCLVWRCELALATTIARFDYTSLIAKTFQRHGTTRQCFSTISRVDERSPLTRAAVGMAIPMGMGIGWVWG